jgi:hypothetical protein
MTNFDKYKNARTAFLNVCKTSTIKTKTEESKICELFKSMDTAQEREAMLTAHKNLHDYIEPFFKKIVEFGGPAATGKGVGVLQAIPPARERANALHN